MLQGKELNKATPVPLYYQLKELILSEIKEGAYPRDSMIPTEKELSDIFGISRTTVRQAISELVQEGWLYRIKSKGTFVSSPKINQDFIQKLEPFNDQIRRTGREPHTEVLDFRIIEASQEVANHLNLQPGDQAVFLQRRRYADDEPIVILETYLPYSRCSFLMEHDFERESLYEVLSRDENTKVYCVRRIVEAIEATAADAEKLNIKKGKPVHYFTTFGYNPVGVPIEVSYARYRGDRSSFEVTVYMDK